MWIRVKRQLAVVIENITLQIQNTARQISETVRKRHTFIHTFFRMTDIMTFQNIDLPSCDILYMYYICLCVCVCVCVCVKGRDALQTFKEPVSILNKKTAGMILQPLDGVVRPTTLCHKKKLACH
jgi:hypothetical protein